MNIQNKTVLVIKATKEELTKLSELIGFKVSDKDFIYNKISEGILFNNFIINERNEELSRKIQNCDCYYIIAID